MKGMLAGFGLAGLPCLLIGGVMSLALIGGTLGAFATNPLVQVAGLASAATAASRVRACRGDAVSAARRSAPSAPVRRASHAGR